ncbi:hypothetical protein CRUP_025592 [Coryphaenoides rupestris]|nr:hypothetical protein CRUP_025592 [Coryphaenoides rupestris]
MSTGLSPPHPLDRLPPGPPHPLDSCWQRMGWLQPLAQILVSVGLPRWAETGPGNTLACWWVPRGLEALERGWGVQTAGAVNTITFRYIQFDAIVPTLPRIRVKFPNLTHLVFMETNLSRLVQLAALAQLRRVEQLTVHTEGNPVASLSLWRPFLIYRLHHFNLHRLNGLEVPGVHVTHYHSVCMFECLTVCHDALLCAYVCLSVCVCVCLCVCLSGDHERCHSSRACVRYAGSHRRHRDPPLSPAAAPGGVPEAAAAVLLWRARGRRAGLSPEELREKRQLLGGAG